MLALLRDPVTRVDVPEPSSLRNCVWFRRGAAPRRSARLDEWQDGRRPARVPATGCETLTSGARRHLRPASRPGASLALGTTQLFPDSTGPVSFPAHRFRVHAGNVTPTGAQDTAFFSGSVTRAAPSCAGGEDWRPSSSRVPGQRQHPAAPASPRRCKWPAPATSSLSGRSMIVPSPVTGWRLTTACPLVKGLSDISVHP